MVAAGLAGFGALTRPTTVRVAGVVVGTVQEETRGPATVQSRFSVRVSARTSGTLDRVLVDVGDEVKKGQVLATLDAVELDARATVALRAVAAAHGEVALAEANLPRARAELALARANSARDRNLVEDGLISIATFDQSNAALGVAGANERAAQVAIEARRAELARIIQERRVADTIASYASITSPMDGLVTRRALEPGSSVAPGVTVLQLVDPTALWATTFIDESLSERVRVGQPARIRLRSGRVAGGRVTRIALEADPVTRELEVDVAFDERPARFAIHEEADVVILGREVRGLTVPLAAVIRGPDGDAVLTVEDGRARRRRVRLGVLGNESAQVLDGVQEGDAIVLEPKGIRDDLRVVVAPGRAGG